MMNELIDLQLFSEKSDHYAIHVFDDYCKFFVQLPDTSMITLIMHKKDTLADLHQKLLNRMRSNRISGERLHDVIPPKTTNPSTTTGNHSSYRHNQLHIYDLFTCRNDTPDILSIPADHSINVSDFLEQHSSLFHSDDTYHTLYVIDSDYYINLQKKKNEKKEKNEKKVSMFSFIRNSLVFLNC
jgi:hypothetical protein